MSAEVWFGEVHQLVVAIAQRERFTFISRDPHERIYHLADYLLINYQNDQYRLFIGNGLKTLKRFRNFCVHRPGQKVNAKLVAELQVLVNTFEHSIQTIYPECISITKKVLDPIVNMK